MRLEGAQREDTQGHSLVPAHWCHEQDDSHMEQSYFGQSCLDQQHLPISRKMNNSQPLLLLVTEFGDT